MSYPQIKPVGDSAITVEFGNHIAPEIHEQVLALDAALSPPPAGVFECVPTYRALLVHYDPLTLSFEDLSTLIVHAVKQADTAMRKPHRWTIPVCYDPALETDMDEFAQLHARTADDIIAEHSAATYRLYMYGFMPGCAYLGGLPDALATPRRSTPRLKVPANSIMVGGAQGLISTNEMPSGWYVLGRTPRAVWTPEMRGGDAPAPGDEITFRPISLAEFEAAS